MTIPEKIARAKELAEKATPGPWETDKLGCMVFLPIKNSEGQRYGVASATDELKPVAGHYSAFEAGSKDEPHANMRFIAESRTLLPDLARECERLQGIIEGERSRTAEAVARVRMAISHRAWLANGERGLHDYDSKEYVKEFGDAVREIEAEFRGLDPLLIDWTNCPSEQKEVDAARLKVKLVAAEAEVERLTLAAKTEFNQKVRLLAEVERVRKLVEDAPHAYGCEAATNWCNHPMNAKPCTCFKSRLHLPE